LEFREIWDRLADLAGDSFQLESGDTFSYEFKRTFVVVRPGALSLPKTNFQKVFLSGAAAVQGRKHIRAILEDPRVAATARETEQ